METTDFVSYELAKKLKEQGFDEPCDSFYDCHFNLRHYATTDQINRNTNGHHTPSCSAPSLWQAQKWLREKKGYDISPFSDAKFIKDIKSYKHTGWRYSIYHIDEDGIMSNGPIGKGLMTTYEKALSAGISAALDLLAGKEGEQIYENKSQIKE